MPERKREGKRKGREKQKEKDQKSGWAWTKSKQARRTFQLSKRGPESETRRWPKSWKANRCLGQFSGAGWSCAWPTHIYAACWPNRLCWDMPLQYHPSTTSWAVDRDLLVSERLDGDIWLSVPSPKTVLQCMYIHLASKDQHRLDINHGLRRDHHSSSETGSIWNQHKYMEMPPEALLQVKVSKNAAAKQKRFKWEFCLWVKASTAKWTTLRVTP